VTPDLDTFLRDHGACDESIEWARGRRVDGRAWRACRRADWLLWIAVRVGVDRRAIVLAACACARTSLRFVPKSERRPLVAIQTAERWARGRATIEEVRAADAAVYTAYAYAGYDAADAAAYVADAAAYAADASAARGRTMSSMAVVVRKWIPWKIVNAALAGKR